MSDTLCILTPERYRKRTAGTRDGKMWGFLLSWGWQNSRNRDLKTEGGKKETLTWWMLAWMSQVVSGWLANRYRLFSLQPLLLFIPFIPLYPSFFIPSPAAGVIGLHIESKFPNFSKTPSSFRQNEGRKTKYKSGSELLSFSLNSQWTNCEKKKCWGKGTTHTHYGTVFMQSTFSFIRFSTSSLEYPKQAVYTFTVSVSREDFAHKANCANFYAEFGFNAFFISCDSTCSSFKKSYSFAHFSCSV